MNPPESNPEPEKKPEWWDKVSAADFDGRTSFRDLTPTQKLMWLSQIQRFVATSKGAARQDVSKGNLGEES